MNAKGLTCYSLHPHWIKAFSGASSRKVRSGSVRFIVLPFLNIICGGFARALDLPRAIRRESDLQLHLVGY